MVIFINWVPNANNAVVVVVVVVVIFRNTQPRFQFIVMNRRNTGYNF